MTWPGAEPRSRGKAIAIAVLVALALGPVSSAKGFDVSSTADTNTAGTLRNAINSANATAGADTITFNGLPSGTQTIALSSALPAITDPVTIDATGHESSAGTPNVVVSGTGVSGSGLSFGAGAADSAVQGLSIVNFASGDGILVNADSVMISGSRLGVDAAGNTAPNATGVTVMGGSEDHVGLSVSGGGNLISGNTQAGVHVTGSADHTHFANNLIGTGPVGAGSVPNGTGILVDGSAANTLIGSRFAGTRNFVSGNKGTGIAVAGSAHDVSVSGDSIGLDVFSFRDPNSTGVEVSSSGTGNVIGGPVGGDGNVLSGNDGNGISLIGTLATVEGNIIGLETGGDLPRANGQAGVFLAGTQNVVTGNVISSNDHNGVQLSGVQNTLQGNMIGTDVTGTAARGNGSAGVHVSDASGGTIGSGNVISANTTQGIEIDGPSDGLAVTGNMIGTDVNGAVPLGSPQPAGISVDASTGAVTGTAIGGAGQENTIAFNRIGVLFESQAFASNGTAVRANSIFGSTSGMGIDFLGDGVTPNDPGDADGGPNGMQNFPVLTSAVSSGGKTVIDGTLNSTPGTSGFAIDLYANNSCSATGNGEARTYLGSIGPVATDAGGNASFEATLAAAVPDGQVITATATDPNANTSELSACRTVTRPPAAPAVSPEAFAAPPLAGSSTQTFTLPVLKLSLPKKERLLKDKAVVLTLRSDTNADYTASGVVSVPKLAAKAMRLKTAKGKLAAGRSTKVKLRASRSLLAAARRAFAHHRRVTATITVVLKDAAGTAKPVRKKLRLVG